MSSWTSLVKNATFNRCTILVAETDKSAQTGFKISRLGNWEDTWKDLQIADPDGFAAYNFTTGLRESIKYGEILSEVWRIHDGTWVDICEEGGVLVVKKFAGSEPNRRYGPWYRRQEEGTLKPEHYGFPDKI